MRRIWFQPTHLYKSWIINESYHTYKKEEELFELQDEIQKLKNENQNLKEKLSEVLNQNFNLTGQETFTVEDPNPTFESMAPETHSQAPPGGGMNLAELEEELMKAKDENEELISKNHLLEDQVDDLNYQIKKLKKVSNLRKSHEVWEMILMGRIFKALSVGEAICMWTF